ncbi:FAD-binding protein [Mycolicibacterium sp. 018/SC-01/001]|uniref:FAD-dependent monooxygenase n=1 Tax=Mycolicibacterium sp. 018/SC-01/001 TaxID=2592069 RepID=UPI00117BF59F|nr:FAD-dependent monooxygenase [Mycolicibacterium sp. 018/SC-01/001]TRW87956.1 FAD-binding protein [Mycolicibacterium sp. 018/SC-01/001]
MRVGIVGSGFAGLAAAIMFRQAGHDVRVFEKSSGPTSADGAISLASNALACLAILGIRDRVETEHWSHSAATIRTPAGRVLVRRTLAELTGGSHYAAVPRRELLRWLAGELPHDCVQYGSAVTQVRPDGVLSVGASEQRFDLVVAADGARGVCRTSLWPEASPVRSTGIRGWSWIVDRELPAGFGPIWGRSSDFGNLPLHDGRTYIYGGTARAGARLADYQTWPDPLPLLIDAAHSTQVSTPEIIEARPPRQLVRGKVVLIGDAAHCMRPTFGQGAALAMEDAITLARENVSGLLKRRRRSLALYAASKSRIVLRHTEIPHSGGGAQHVTRRHPRSALRCYGRLGEPMAAFPRAT